MPRPLSSARDCLFRALAAPTRRRILDLLAEHGRLTVGKLAAEFPDLIPSGISKHLMELRAAGLVHAKREGRQQVYRINGPAFARVLAPWLALYEPYWTDALERLRDLAEGGRPPGSALRVRNRASPRSKARRGSNPSAGRAG
jgi:DNA-binding transcriptional ArsR family regulator